MDLTCNQISNREHQCEGVALQRAQAYELVLCRHIARVVHIVIIMIISFYVQGGEGATEGGDFNELWSTVI